MQQSCYMCDSPATSSEHAPPKCFFPTLKATGKDLRRNLITVPACDAHNSEKSKDDEYLRAVILLASGASSDLAKAHFFDKLMRAAKRKPHSHAAFVNPIGLRLGSGEMLQIDLDRFNRCIFSLGAAIYFHRFKNKLRSKIHVVSPHLYGGGQGSVHVSESHASAIDVTRQFLASEPTGGENEEVFMYRARYEPESEMYAFAAIFYEAFEVFGATPRPVATA